MGFPQKMSTSRRSWVISPDESAHASRRGTFSGASQSIALKEAAAHNEHRRAPGKPVLATKGLAAGYAAGRGASGRASECVVALLVVHENAVWPGGILAIPVGACQE